MVVAPGTTVDNARKIAVEPREIAATAGAASILFLLNVPERELFTLQMEHEVNKKERSW